MYIKRIIENKIEELSKQFPVLILTGPRQVGKSTTLLMNKFENMNYVTLDDLNIRALAKRDPKYFLEMYGTPLIIDEIQYAPNLLPYIKINVDNERLFELKNNLKNKCLYWLIGSQQFSVMKDISESLAGRVGILNLSSLSFDEIENNPNKIFIPDVEYLKQKNLTKNYSTKDIYNYIYNGGMPNIIANNIDKNVFFSSYLTTYIERDIRNILNIKDILSFYNFIQYLAVRTGQELNYNTISSDIGIDSKTVKNWISVLESTRIIYLLQPYYSNLTNRIIKSPKLYFMDTGLCSYLGKYQNIETLEAGAMSGAIFETYVVSEIVKNFWNNGIDPKMSLYYYRDKDKKEIDLLYINNDNVYPIEIKKGINPNHPNKNFEVLNKFNLNVKPGIVVCLANEITPINKNCTLVPVKYI